MKKKFKTESAITLIALVITIIVLLILAGVALATLTGENGILTKATTSNISLSFSMTSRACVPIEPVEPNIASFLIY